MQTSTGKHIKRITATALFTALYIVLDRWLAIVPSTVGTSIKITFAVTVLMLCGYLLGPISGAVCGVLADIIGSILSGFPPYLPLTAKPLLLGAIPGLLVWLYRKKRLSFDPFHPIAVALTVVISETLVSGGFATLALSWLMGTTFEAQLYLRLPVVAVSMAIDAALSVLLLSSDALRKAAKKYLS